MASLTYGAGLRLMERVELRIKDVNFDRGELTVRDGKGGKDRVTMLPVAMKGRLFDHVTRVKTQHEADLTAGRGSVALPGALRAKYPNAPREWVWQWVFPATRFYVDPETGERRRHHLHESVLQRAVKEAARAAGIPRPVTCHSLRHSFATHLLDAASREYCAIEFWISRSRTYLHLPEVMIRVAVPLELKSPTCGATLRPQQVMPSYRVRETTC